MSSEENEISDYWLAKQDHAYAVGFQAGLILATAEEQTLARQHGEPYSQEYQEQVAAVDRQRVEALKVIKNHDKQT